MEDRFDQRWKRRSRHAGLHGISPQDYVRRLVNRAFRDIANHYYYRVGDPKADEKWEKIVNERKKREERWNARNGISEG